MKTKQRIPSLTRKINKLIRDKVERVRLSNLGKSKIQPCSSALRDDTWDNNYPD